MSVESKKNLLIPQDDRLYPTQVRTETERVTELSVRGDQSLERSNDKANSEIQRLSEQAPVLMEQAENVGTGSRIQTKKQAAVSAPRAGKTENNRTPALRAGARRRDPEKRRKQQEKIYKVKKHKRSYKLSSLF